MARKPDKTTTIYINVANSVLVAPSEDGGKVAGDFLLASLQVHDQGHAYAAVRAR